MVVAEIVLGALAAYLAIGLVFAVWFLAFGVRRIDPDAAGAGVLVKLLLTPGSALLWPVLLRRLATGVPQ